MKRLKTLNNLMGSHMNYLLCKTPPRMIFQKKSELEVVKEILNDFIMKRNLKELRNQPAKEVADLKVAVSNILMRHLKI